MTTIIAIENSDHVLMGSDSQVTTGYQKQPLSQGKIFTNGEYTFGVAGYFRFLQALEHVTLPKPNSGSLLSQMVTSVVPAIMEQTKHLTVRGRDESETQFDHSSVLVAVKGQVFEVGGDGSVIHSRDGVYSIGSGSSYALGALGHVTGEPTEADVRHALAVAARHDIGTSGPFWVKRV